MPDIELFELGVPRSSRVRWILIEAGLAYESLGNSIDVFKNAELRKSIPWESCRDHRRQALG